jgi:tRNA modification GTPase
MFHYSFDGFSISFGAFHVNAGASGRYLTIISRSLKEKSPMGYRGRMERPAYSDRLPMFALATPFSESALALVRVSGEGALDLLAPAFSRPGALLGAKGGNAVHGWIVDPSGDHGRIDEVVVLPWRAPSGYTGEDGADIMGHGSLSAIRAVMSALARAGFREALPGEFSLRAFLNGKMDLTKAEAVGELIASRTEAARGDAVERLSGRLAEAVARIRSCLVSAMAQVHVQLDYALEDDVADMGMPRAGLESALSEIRGLSDSYLSGRLYRDGARVALAGRTNSGKSSLFNLFLKEDRAIVSEVHGTTRDYLEAWIDLAGVPVLLYDTAGFRQGATDIEREGIERSRRLLSGADIVLYLVDSERGLSEEDSEFLEGHGPEARLVPVWSRSDKAAFPCPAGFCPVSAKSGSGFPELGRLIASRLFRDRGGPGSERGLHVASERQKGLLDRAASALEACLDADAAGEPLDATEPDLRDALEALGEITGESAGPDLLEEIFSRFCVGK